MGGWMGDREVGTCYITGLTYGPNPGAAPVRHLACRGNGPRLLHNDLASTPVPSFHAIRYAMLHGHATCQDVKLQCSRRPHLDECADNKLQVTARRIPPQPGPPIAHTVPFPPTHQHKPDDPRHSVATTSPTMHSSWMRIQNVFSYFTTVLFALGACIAVSDLLTPRAPVVNSLKFTNLQVYHPPPSPP